VAAGKKEDHLRGAIPRLSQVRGTKALRRICTSLSPRKVQALFDRWIKLIPQPLTPEDSVASYDWELSMNQIEFSRTLVLDRPVRARAFEHVIAQNLGLGRP
jgi:hypothetical protein